jgi:hypothetical protein
MQKNKQTCRQELIEEDKKRDFAASKGATLPPRPLEDLEGTAQTVIYAMPTKKHLITSAIAKRSPSYPGDR